MGSFGFERQINRLRNLEVPELFGVQDEKGEKLRAWLGGCGVDPSLMGHEINEKPNRRNSFVILPSRGRTHDGDLWNYYQQLLPDLEIRSGVEGVATRRSSRANPYVLQGVSYDTWGEVAEMAVRDWPNLPSKLCQLELIGLTVEEIVTMLAYDSERFNAFLALGSVSEQGIVPCLEPHSGKWFLSSKQLTDLGKDIKDEMSQETRWCWTRPYGGDALRLTAPTAQRILPA